MTFVRPKYLSLANTPHFAFRKYFLYVGVFIKLRFYTQNKEIQTSPDSHALMGLPNSINNDENRPIVHCSIEYRLSQSYTTSTLSTISQAALLTNQRSGVLILLFKMLFHGHYDYSRQFIRLVQGVVLIDSKFSIFHILPFIKAHYKRFKQSKLRWYRKFQLFSKGQPMIIPGIECKNQSLQQSETLKWILREEKMLILHVLTISFLFLRLMTRKGFCLMDSPTIFEAFGQLLTFRGKKSWLFTDEKGKMKRVAKLIL